MPLASTLPNPDYLHHPHFKAAAETVDEQTRIAALATFMPALQRAFADWLGGPRPDLETRIGAGDQALGELQRDGVALLAIEAAKKARLKDLTRPMIEDLEGKLGAIQGKPKFRDMNLALEKDQHKDIYRAVNDAFADLHLLDIASAYVRKPLKIKRLYVQLNNAHETAVRYGPIDEAGLPTLKTDYFHIDSDIWPSVKVLIYLNDVGLDQGPFRYVAGSHHCLSDFEILVRKTNDSLRLPTAQFVALPDEFRMHALFGPYLQGDEPGAAALLERERVLCGGGADLVLFDNNGVHRGGFVRQGARHLMQCLFTAA